MFQQYGIELSKTMADWLMRCSDLFRPLYDRLREMLLEKTVIQADETTLNLLKEDKATSICGCMSRALTHRRIRTYLISCCTIINAAVLGNVRLIFLTASQVARAHVRRKSISLKVKWGKPTGR